MSSNRRNKKKFSAKSLVEAESDFPILRCVTSTPVSCITLNKNREASLIDVKKRKASAELRSNAKKFKNQDLLSDPFIPRFQALKTPENGNHLLQFKQSGANDLLELSGLKPIIIFPQFEVTNQSELQTIEISDIESMADENVVVVEDSPTNVEQPVILLQRMTPEYVQNMLNGKANKLNGLATVDRQCETIPINYNSWQWQPQLKLTKLTENDLKNHIHSKHGKSWTLADSMNQIDPIEFDKDEFFIRELSPQTATERFEKVRRKFIGINFETILFKSFTLHFQRIKEIRKSIQPVLSKPNNMKRGRAKAKINMHHLEYEETHKKLQEEGKKFSSKKTNSSSRKLYSQP